MNYLYNSFKKTTIFFANDNVSIDSLIGMDCQARFSRFNGENPLFLTTKEYTDKFVEKGICLDNKERYISKRSTYQIKKNFFDLIKDLDCIYEHDDGFYLLIDRFIRELEKIEMPINYKDRFDDFFNRKDIYHLNLSILDSEKTIGFILNKPEMMYGVSFVVIPILYRGVLELVNEDEDEALSYLNDDTNIIVFSGLYSFNPITQRRIPIFIGNIAEPFLGCPGNDELSSYYAVTYDLEMFDLPRINNPIDEELIRQDVIKNLLSNGLLVKETIYQRTSIKIISKENDKMIFEDFFNCVDALVYPLLDSFEIDMKLDYLKQEINQNLPYSLIYVSKVEELIYQSVFFKCLDIKGFLSSDNISLNYYFDTKKSYDELTSNDCYRLVLLTGIKKEKATEFLDKAYTILGLEIDDSFTSLNEIFRETIEDVHKLYKIKNYQNVIHSIDSFLDRVISIGVITKDIIIGLAVSLNPIIPFITEQLFSLTNPKHFLLFEDWPNA